MDKVDWQQVSYNEGESLILDLRPLASPNQPIFWYASEVVVLPIARSVPWVSARALLMDA
jgi:hypothetical protein